MKHAYWQLIWVVLLTATFAGIGASILWMGESESSSDEKGPVNIQPPVEDDQSSLRLRTNVISMSA
jgi:hypothetical protein